MNKAGANEPMTFLRWAATDDHCPVGTKGKGAKELLDLDGDLLAALAVTIPAQTQSLAKTPSRKRRMLPIVASRLWSGP